MVAAVDLTKVTYGAIRGMMQSLGDPRMAAFWLYGLHSAIIWYDREE